MPLRAANAALPGCAAFSATMLRTARAAVATHGNPGSLATNLSAAVAAIAGVEHRVCDRAAATAAGNDNAIAEFIAALTHV